MLDRILVFLLGLAAVFAFAGSVYMVVKLTTWGEQFEQNKIAKIEENTSDVICFRTYDDSVYCVLKEKKL